MLTNQFMKKQSLAIAPAKELTLSKQAEAIRRWAYSENRPISSLIRSVDDSQDAAVTNLQTLGYANAGISLFVLAVAAESASLPVLLALTAWTVLSLISAKKGGRHE